MLGRGKITAERYAACGHVVASRRGHASGPVDEALAALGYDKTVEDTIINEFQAYILQDGARTGRLEKFVPQYQKPLRKFVGIADS